MKSKELPRVSVIIPVYNGEKYLCDCLDSILIQTYTEIEILCVNDGSTDNSADILEQYKRNDKRIVIVNQKNSGQSSARNKGMEVAEGKYIAFVDCDDYVEKNMLEKLVLKAEETNADIVITNILLYFEDTLNLQTFRDEPLYYSLKNKVFTLNQYPEIIKNIGIWDRIFRKDFLEEHKIRFLEGVVYEDHLFCIESEALAKRIALIPDHLYYYRKNAGGSITDKEKENDNFKKDYILIHSKIQEILDRTNSSQEVQTCYLEYFLTNGIMHQKNATSFRFYIWFFRQMKKMLMNQQFEMVNQLDNQTVKEYSSYLHNNELIKCYFKLH